MSEIIGHGYKEKTEFYKLGYQAGFRNCILKVLKYCDDRTIFDKLVEEYNSHPLIDKMEIYE